MIVSILDEFNQGNLKLTLHLNGWLTIADENNSSGVSTKNYTNYTENEHIFRGFIKGKVEDFIKNNVIVDVKINTIQELYY